MKPRVAWNWQATCMIKVQEIDNTRSIFMSKLDTLKNLKFNFKMLQDISLILWIKKATKCVTIFLSQKWLDWGSRCGCMSNLWFCRHHQMKICVFEVDGVPIITYCKHISFKYTFKLCHIWHLSQQWSLIGAVFWMK